MNKKIYTFFVLVFVFCGSLFADCETDKLASLQYLDEVTNCLYSIEYQSNSIRSMTGAIDQITTDGQIRSHTTGINTSSRSIDYNAQRAAYLIGSFRGIVEGIDCGTNGTCSVDLGSLVQVCSNIYDVVSSEYSAVTNCENYLRYISGEINSLTSLFSYDDINSVVGGNTENPNFWLNVKYPELLAVVSNLNNDVSSSFNTLTNQVASLNSNFDYFLNDSYAGFPYLIEIAEYCVDFLEVTQGEVRSIWTSVQNIYREFRDYFPYLQTISQDLAAIGGSLTNRFYASSLLGFDRFRYYAQGQLNNTQVALYPLSPYDSATNLRTATIYDALSSGFASLLISQGSINNYLYWLKAIAGSNRLDAVESHLVAVSNLVGRLDDYVLGDFSNEVSRLVETLSYVTNRVDYTTNLVEIASLLQTSTNHLASIDSKLDVLDYIKVLSDTPLSDFSGDSYYDYLTNLYLNGASSSPSTNWFERIEILLASIVFGDSGASTISNEVEFTNFSEETLENAFNDYTFQNELNSGIDLVENTGQNFLTILRGFHDSLSSVSQPQSIAIGLGGLDGQDTTTFQDVMHGHFQVSFSSGAVDNFTLIVRSMTTIIWILITMMFVYFSSRWLLSKVLFFYRLMRSLIASLFLK